MSLLWTITHNGVTQSLADWGITNAVITRRSLATSQLTFDIPALKLDDPPTFAYGDTLTLKRDGTPYFFGRIQQPAIAATPQTEGQSFVVEDPWCWLEHIPFMQLWGLFIGGVLGTGLKSRLHLFRNANGDLQTAQALVTDVLNYAIAAGAPLQIGAIDLPIQPPAEEAADLQCAAVIVRATRWQPDRVGWFDYSTTPPTFHLTARANLPVTTLTLGADRLDNLNFTPRHDLRVPSVTIYQDNSDGDSHRTVAIDQYPVGSSPAQYGALVATLSLQPSTVNTLTQEVGVLTNTPGSEDWFYMMLPALKKGAFDGTIDNFSIVPGSVYFQEIEADGSPGTGSATAPSQYPNTLISGALARWMPVGGKRYYVSALLNYEVFKKNGSAPRTSVRTAVAERCTVTCVLTSATNHGETNPYQLAVVSSGETPYTGIAQSLYQALYPIQWDGGFSLHEPDCGARPFLGRAVNIANGQSAWATMNAMVNEVTERLDHGQTTVRVGPPPYLTITDVIQLMQATRNRKWLNAAEIPSAFPGGGRAEVIQPILSNDFSATTAGGETSEQIGEGGS